MKPILRGGFTIFGAAVAPVLYLSGASLSSALPISVLHKSTDWNWKNWVEAYNNSFTFKASENAEAFLAKAIPRNSKIEKVFINQDTKYLKNRQLGIKILASDSYQGDYGISPYKVFLTNAEENGQINQESLGELTKKVHVIEWDGTKDGSSEENYRGVIAVSFVPVNKLEVLLKQLNEQDQKIWDIDIRDILKEAVTVDYTSGKNLGSEELKNLLDHEDISSKPQQETTRVLSNETTYDEYRAKSKVFIQALRDDANWVKRSWYKGDKIKLEEGGEELYQNHKYEVTIPEKYLKKNGESSWVEFNEDLVKKHLKVTNGRDQNIVIRSISSGEQVVIDKKSLSTNFLIRRRNINVLRGVIKEIFKQEEIEDIDADKTEYSYLELLGIMKKKFIIDTFRELHWKCSTNEIPDENGWFLLEEESEIKTETPKQKFCDKWEYPELTDYWPDYDPVIALSEIVWKDLENKFKEAVLPLCNLLEKEINPYLSSVYRSYKSLDPKLCEIKPKTQIVSEHKIPKEPELTEESIKQDLIEMIDKFGIYGKSFKDNKFTTSQSQAESKDKLVPIVWSNKSFIRRNDESGWSLNYDYADIQTKENHKQVKITKIKEWK